MSCKTSFNAKNMGIKKVDKSTLRYNSGMKHILLIITLLLTNVLHADYKADISHITPKVKQRMIKGNSWRKSCPVLLKDLRYLTLSYQDFNGNTKMGEMIVHKEVASEVKEIFKALYKTGYPIRKMHLVSDYKGSDWQSIEADNTSAFNCRKATGSKNWSKHSYGKAIDLNSIENPYISRSGHISHKASQKYRKRAHTKNTAADKAVLLKNGKVVKLFKRYGWKWGGDWSGVKDYQHFSK
jgi:poly-gamma-glutamate synthesis protein (capsule biosynthesis protein)